MSDGITSYGGAEEVTGSKHLLSLDNKKYLFDCGLYQGSNKHKQINIDLFLNPKSLDAIFLSHAHLDHSGLIPFIVKKGFQGPIYATQPTKDLVEPLWRDSVEIMRSEKKELLFHLGDVKHAHKLIKVIKWGEELRINAHTVIFHPSSHILGSSCIEIRNNNLSLLFSGDLGRPDSLLYPSLPNRPASDYVIMECTYGDRLHPQWSQEQLISSLKRAIKQQGTLLIAAFAIDRTQIILYLLHQIFQKNPQLKLPVWLSGKLGITCQEIYQRYGEQLKIDKSTLKAIQTMPKELLWNKQKEKFYQKNRGAEVIIAASGMLAGGSIHFHLENLAHDPKNQLLLTGFQAPGTPGHQLLQGNKNLQLKGKEIVLKMDVQQLQGLSSHPDQQQLIQWIKSAKNPSKVLLSHGEVSSLKAMKSKLDDLNLESEILVAKKFYPLN